MSTESNTPKRSRAGIKLRAGIIRWRPNEYDQLACAMVPEIAKGRPRLKALALAQRLLPKERQRPAVDLIRNVNTRLMKAALAKASAMSAAERQAHIEAMQTELRDTLQAKITPPPPKAKLTRVADAVRPLKGTGPDGPTREMKTNKRGFLQPMHSVRWKDPELARVARRVAYYQRELQDTRVLSRLIKVAQDIELPPDRRRSPAAIDSGLARMRKELIRGFTLAHTLLTDVPFDPSLTAYPEPTPAPGAVFEFVDESKLQEAAAAPEVAQAPEPVSAPTPPPQARAPVTEPIRAFGEVFAQGMSDLIQNMTRQMMSELELRLSAMSERLMQNAIDTMARGVTTMVHSALERELGGPVDSAPQSFDLPRGATLPDALQLDVVGLIGHQITEVRKQLNGYADSMRFIDADQVGSWTPRKTVVINTKFISHAVEGKCRSKGVKPIRVQGGASAMVNAIKELYAQEGITLPH